MEGCEINAEHHWVVHMLIIVIRLYWEASCSDFMVEMCEFVFQYDFILKKEDTELSFIE